MANEIISYLEMCQREGTNLQRGMNYGLGGTHSVILMSLRSNAPYRDRLDDDGSVLIYEGHDEPRRSLAQDPKKLDQPQFRPKGRLTQNGYFHGAAQSYKRGERLPERVRVYEKILSGVWSYNGVFHLVDSWQEPDEHRQVFKFKLIAVEGEEDLQQSTSPSAERRRIIPSAVKLAVWKRDEGKCVVCKASDELHFDHVIPFSRGGTSVTAENVQLLCTRHNLEKSNKIV
ncbi:HNH endonuclease [Leptolyngbya sp. AN02str]|uniref:HNH endonuclease n=1 Tax=Leptolyngbya sp. AN02str TaxID=3423363 RepID=UPI003D315655